jgi:GNAT superfamily N-acetyltransferase
MEINNTRFQVIRVCDLDALSTQDWWQTSAVLPISPQRALSQSHNPHAQPEDVALLVLVKEGQVLAYLGAMAEVLHVASGPQRVGWLTCLWVSPVLRGQGIATQLLREMTEHWQGKTILTEFAPQTRKMYERSGIFTESEALIGVRGYLRPNLADILPQKRPFFARTRLVWRLVDMVLSWPNALRLQFFKTKMPRFCYLSGIDAPTAAFIQQRQSRELARRDATALNWLLAYPWIQAMPLPDDTAQRYHFSSVARDFQQIPIQLLDDTGRSLGFLVLTLRDGHLKIPYFYVDEQHIAAAAQLIFAHALRLRVHMMSCYHADLSKELLHGKTPFFAKKRLRRSCFVSNALMRLLPPGPVALQDGDGDVGFT